MARRVVAARRRLTTSCRCVVGGASGPLGAGRFRGAAGRTSRGFVGVLGEWIGFSGFASWLCRPEAPAWSIDRSMLRMEWNWQQPRSALAAHSALPQNPRRPARSIDRSIFERRRSNFGGCADVDAHTHTQPHAHALLPPAHTQNRHTHHNTLHLSHRPSPPMPQLKLLGAKAESEGAGPAANDKRECLSVCICGQSQNDAHTQTPYKNGQPHPHPHIPTQSRPAAAGSWRGCGAGTS